ncbi:hypothetical protein FSP39_023933 [Pinctada imbricata]|uniref:DAGKc domain-containing protein n=1 Tax=Pinctada imbricata TaxID=66713 RepID=A0AA88YUM8_PINIB|nr:hypothetical protein FSP39_023933 [Pinctada imbricata]
MADYTFDDEGNPVRRTIDDYDDNFADEEDLTNIFDIKGDGFDVTLSLATGQISWTTVNAAKVNKKFKNAKPYGTGTYHAGKFELPIRDILGVKIKRQRTKNQREGEGLCRGFTVLTYEKFGPNCLKDRLIEFEHPSESICQQYSKSIKRYITGLSHRPKSVKIFMQVHAGSHDSKSIYKNKVLPLMQDAELNVDCTEVQHNEHIKMDMVHLNLDDYDCVVAMGGDGTANKVASGLLTASQGIHDVEIKNGFTPAKAVMPLGIIPTGTTNYIAKSAIGIDDPVTATIHILLGNRTPLDICSVFQDERLLQFGFISQYGFQGNVLRYVSSLRTKAVPKYSEAAVIHALKSSRLRSYDCDIEYIPADKLDSKYCSLMCRTGCMVCWNQDVTEEEETIVEECTVEPFSPLSNSNNSDTFVDLSKEERDNPWRKIKSNLMNIALFTIPGFCSSAPWGLSKYSHSNDGVMELVLVKNIIRKDFIRFLKRHGNMKNQFDFEFVDVIRVKEVKFRPRQPTGWNYNDHSFSEVEYRMKNLKSRRSKSETVIHLDDDGLENGKSHSMDTLDDLSDDDDDDDDIDDLDDFHKPNSSRNGSAGSETSQQRQFKINNNVIMNTAHQDRKLVGPQYRMTFADEERLKRKKVAIKKEEKKRAKEEKRLKSSWNIDNTICYDGELDFKQVF